MSNLDLNILVLAIAIVCMCIFIICTKNKIMRKSLIWGTCITSVWFFIRNIFPLLNFNILNKNTLLIILFNMLAIAFVYCIWRKHYTKIKTGNIICFFSMAVVFLNIFMKYQFIGSLWIILMAWGLIMILLAPPIGEFHLICGDYRIWTIDEQDGDNYIIVEAAEERTYSCKKLNAVKLPNIELPEDFFYNYKKYRLEVSAKGSWEFKRCP